jgi:hypothetical protein
LDLLSKWEIKLSCSISNVIGNVKEALQLTRELLKIVPFHQRGLSNARYYEDILHQEGEIQFQHQETAGYTFID